jgi:hypothetical protein
MTWTATSVLPDWGLAVWDMYVQYENGEKDTLFKGQAILLKEVAT